MPTSVAPCSAVVKSPGGPAVPATATASTTAPDNCLELRGTQLGDVTEHDAMMLDFHVPLLVNRLRASGQIVPEGMDTLLAAAHAAHRDGNHYRAFRLYARAAGLAHGPEQVEAFEVAASLDVSINRAIFSEGERIALTLSPLFSLGHPLLSGYTARSWLEGLPGVLAGTEQARLVRDLEPTTFEFPLQGVADGIVAVAYRLDRQRRHARRVRYAVVIARDSQRRLGQLATGLAALRTKGSGVSRTPTALAALETLEHHTRALEAERRQFDGPWQRRAHPFGMHWGAVGARAAGRPPMGFPTWAGPVRYPEDIALAESFVDALARGDDAPLRPSGETQQAYLSSDGELIPYRVFVPEGYDPTRQYPLVVAIHSGAGAGTYFEWQANAPADGTAPKDNALKRLAQERGYVVACPNGRAGSFGEFLSPRGEADVIAVLRRVQSVYSIDPKRVFLTGWSVGSAATWHIGIRHPELFRAMAPVAGAATWLSGDTTRSAAALGVLYSAGARDASVEEARRTSALAKTLLPRFEYLEYPDATHDGVWAAALTALFDFFDRCGSSNGLEQNR